MCGRYVVAYDPETLVAGFSLTRIPPFERSWNVAPTSMVPVVYETRAGERVGELMRWGLVPHWAKDPSVGAKHANARREGLFETPAFRQAAIRRRCLLPASGFYEWQVVPGPGRKPAKQPWYVSPAGAPFVAMAGVFEAWRANPEAPWMLTCCVITTDADALLAPVHERMPVMLPREHWAAWLARGEHDPQVLAPLLCRQLPPGALRAWPVDRAVGHASAQGPQLIEPVPARPPD